MINIEKEVDRILTLLRNKIRERDFTQLDVQDKLEWGRSYISQLLTKQKSLRVEQVLAILDVISIDPSDFFAELYRWGTPEAAGAQSGGAPSVSFDPAREEELRQRIDQLQASIDRVSRLLMEKRLISLEELEGAVLPASGGKRKKASATRRA